MKHKILTVRELISGKWYFRYPFLKNPIYAFRLGTVLHNGNTYEIVTMEYLSSTTLSELQNIPRILFNTTGYVEVDINSLPIEYSDHVNNLPLFKTFNLPF